MSEIVQCRMEAMTEELEELRRVKLFKVKETREILKKRREFEYKINGVNKNIEDYKDYIEYEKLILEAVKLRRMKFKIAEKLGSIEHKIIKRIKILFETALQRFSNEIVICMSYFKFARQTNYLKGSASAVHAMVTHHPHSAEVWQIASKYHLHDRKDPQTALKMLHKGLSINKDSTLLYNEVIRQEIFQILGKDANSKLEETEELIAKQNLCIEKLQLYLQTIFKNVNTYTYYLDLLTFFEEYKFTPGLQNEIVNHLLLKHSDQPQVWRHLALRERNGFHYEAESSSTAKSLRGKLTICFAKFKEGLQKVPESAKQELWNLYIEYLIEIGQDDFGNTNVLKTKTLNEAYQQACVEGYLSETYFISWIQNIAAAEQKYNIATKGTERYPQSALLWRLRFYLKQDLVFDSPEGSAEINQLFQLGVEALKERSLSLWNGIIRFHLINSDMSVLEEIYKEGAKQPGEVGKELKPRYITWLNLNRGIGAARKAYHLIARTPPFCKALHEAMWRAETTEMQFDFDSWVEVHRLAVEQFGGEDIDVWIDYLRFYMLYNKNADVGRATVESIKDTALKTLPDFLRIEFHDKYIQLQDLASRGSDN